VLVLVVVVAVGYGDLNKHHTNSVTVTTQTTTTTTTQTTTTTTTTQPPPTTTTTRPHHVVTKRHSTTTTTRPRPPTTTTTRRVTTGMYKISFTCSGGQNVTITGTGPTSANTLTVTGPSNHQASGRTATVSFTALAGTYVATDHDSNGGTFINYASGGQASACS